MMVSVSRKLKGGIKNMGGFVEADDHDGWVTF
jgi:hypothetical protein